MGRNLPRNTRLRWRGLIACVLLIGVTIASAVIDDRWAVYHLLPGAGKWLQFAIVPLGIISLVVAIWTGRVWWRVPNVARVPSRRRTVIKWTGLPITLVLAFAWIASIFWYAGWDGPKLSKGFNISAGSLRVWTWTAPEGASVTYYGDPNAAEWFVRWSEFDFEFDWLPSVLADSTGGRHLQIPIWIFLLGIGLPTLLAWYRDRPVPPFDACRQCGYNLRGNVSRRCPECGQDV